MENGEKLTNELGLDQNDLDRLELTDEDLDQVAGGVMHDPGKTTITTTTIIG